MTRIRWNLERKGPFHPMTGPESEAQAAQDLAAVRAVLAGDRNAFRGLVTRYQGLVAGIAWRYGVRREDVEDMVSEIFTKSYTHLGQFRPDHPFATWLYRLAANHVIDHARRARKERHRVEMPEQVEDGRPGAEDGMEAHERVALLRSALETVDIRYREALFLVYVEGIKVEDTARLLGIPEGTVKTRLMRGREALKKALVRRHPEHFGGCA
jgi:RNA polymerase sigma-70 factor (ECF subfamily)